MKTEVLNTGDREKLKFPFYIRNLGSLEALIELIFVHSKIVSWHKHRK